MMDNFAFLIAIWVMLGCMIAGQYSELIPDNKGFITELAYVLAFVLGWPFVLILKIRRK